MQDEKIYYSTIKNSSLHKKYVKSSMKQTKHITSYLLIWNIELAFDFEYRIINYN